MQLSNYLFFTAACQEALDFYTRCGFGEFVTLVRHGDNGLPVRTESMHTKFEGPGIRFFASDNDDAEPMRGSAMMFELDNREQTQRLFNDLAAGGHVTTRLAVQPWGDYFGKLTDRFGVQWMFSCSC